MRIIKNVAFFKDINSLFEIRTGYLKFLKSLKFLLRFKINNLKEVSTALNLTLEN